MSGHYRTEPAPQDPKKKEQNCVCRQEFSAIENLHPKPIRLFGEREWRFQTENIGQGLL